MKHSVIAMLVCYCSFAQGAVGQEKTPADAQNPTYYACAYGVDDQGMYSCASYDARFFCDQIADIGREICGIYYSPEGFEAPPFDAPEVADDQGGTCGYHKYKVTCHFPSPMVPVAETSALPVNPAGPQPLAVAKAFCAQAAPSSKRYRFFPRAKGGGGGQGNLTIQVLCYP
jgi:hypothetical protein